MGMCNLFVILLIHLQALLAMWPSVCRLRDSPPPPPNHAKFTYFHAGLGENRLSSNDMPMSMASSQHQVP